MIKVQITCKVKLVVNLPVDSFEDIMSHNMPIDVSDELIVDAISEKYGINAQDIRVIGEVK